jgi:hypothetical protein
MRTYPRTLDLACKASALQREESRGREPDINLVRRAHRASGGGRAPAKTVSTSESRRSLPRRHGADVFKRAGGCSIQAKSIGRAWARPQERGTSGAPAVPTANTSRSAATSLAGRYPIRRVSITLTLVALCASCRGKQTEIIGRDDASVALVHRDAASPQADAVAEASTLHDTAPERDAMAGLPPFTYRPFHVGQAAIDFTLDVPSFFVVQGPPGNGKGLGWAWGERARLSAWFMYADPLETLASRCGPGAVLSASSCVRTETIDGETDWERTDLAFGCWFSVRLQYDEILSSAFAPVLTHIMESWTVYQEPDHAMPNHGLRLVRP